MYIHIYVYTYINETFAYQPTLVSSYVVVHKRTSLMSSSLLIKDYQPFENSERQTVNECFHTCHRRTLVG